MSEGGGRVTAGLPATGSTMTPDSDDRSELDKIRERLDGAMGALHILGSQVRALRAEVEALRGEPK